MKIPRFVKNVGRDIAFVKECWKRHLPLIKTYKIVRKLKKEKAVSTAFVVTTDWPLNTKKDTFFLNADYLERCLKLNRRVRDLFMDKTVLYERCPEFLGRDCLNLKNASDEDILSFFHKHKRFVGKLNYGSGAKNFCAYETDKYPDNELLNIIRKNGQDILEEYIVQDEAILDIYPDAVSTLRIHTVNNGKEIRSYIKPKIRIGCNGSDTDIGGTAGSYKAIVNEDGSIDIAVYHNQYNYIYIAKEHCNTKVKFADVRIPYVKESVELVKKAAARFPEAAYIGWDVAITPNGPVLVEANAISGAFNTYQMISYIQRGVGMKKEIDEMLKFAENRE